eukprot:gene7786-9135_t
MQEKKAGGVRVKAIFVTKYTRIGTTITWHTVPGAGSNMTSIGKFTVTYVSSNKSILTAESSIGIDIDVPKLLASVARSLGAREMNQTWDTYLQSIKKKVESYIAMNVVKIMCSTNESFSIFCDTSVLSPEQDRSAEHDVVVEATTPVAAAVAAALPTAEAPKKICCACPETKKVRDECIMTNGEDKCLEFIDAHKQCLRAEGFDI